MIISIQLAHELRRELPGRGVVQPGPIRRRRAEALRVDSVRRRRQPLCRRGVRQHGVDVVLRMLLREFRFAPTDAPGERARWRGVATVPARGARAVVYRRTAEASMMLTLHRWPTTAHWHTGRCDRPSQAVRKAHRQLLVVQKNHEKYCSPTSPAGGIRMTSSFSTGAMRRIADGPAAGLFGTSPTGTASSCITAR